MWNKAKGDFILFWNHKRKTATVVDVLYAFKRQGCTLYGSGGYRITETLKNSLTALIGAIAFGKSRDKQQW